MGCIYLHQCPACGYEEQASGGPDGGFVTSTNTFVCMACQLLCDRNVGEERRRFPEGDETYFHRFRPRCPKCRRSGALRPWKTGDPCPKCGTAMEQDPGFAVLWD